MEKVGHSHREPLEESWRVNESQDTGLKFFFHTRGHRSARIKVPEGRDTGNGIRRNLLGVVCLRGKRNLNTGLGVLLGTPGEGFGALIYHSHKTTVEPIRGESFE